MGREDRYTAIGIQGKSQTVKDAMREKQADKELDKQLVGRYLSI